MTSRHGLVLGILVFAGAGLIAICNLSVAESAQRGGAVFYVATPSTDFDLIASRYDVFIVDDVGYEIEALRAASPQGEIYRYNSISDNYVSGSYAREEGDYLEQLAARKGWDIEDAYLHYWDDTSVKLDGTDVVIPGWGGGSAVTKEEARVPVYYSDLSRRAVNVSTYRGAQLVKETVIALGIDNPFPNTAVFADGLFLDNMGTMFWNTGTINSGGHVLETPGRLLMASPEYQAWHWDTHWAPFLASLRDTLRSAASWGPDGKNKKVMINISSSWTDDVPNQGVADVFYLEYQYSPMRNAGDYWVQNAINWDRAAAQTGGVMFYSAKPITERPGHAGSVTLEEAKLGNYAWYLVTKTDQTLFFQSNTYSAGKPEYITDNWAGCMDVAREQFGNPLEEPRVLTSGTDPRGYAYKVYVREYEGGLALLRNRGSWDQDADASTTVTVTLPVAMYPVAPDGTLGSLTSVISMANGRGALFVKTGNPPPPGGDGQGPDPIQDLAYSFRLLATSPAAGAQNVATGTEIRWLLSDAVDVPISAAWVTVSGSSSGTITGSLTVTGGNRVLAFTPGQPLAWGETVTATLSAKTQRHDGETLDGNADGVSSGNATDAVRITFVVAVQE